tara:strand:+ start:28510 stop:28929 length:420 start_codon:yes stop_codon:yes gene_type:complete
MKYDLQSETDISKFKKFCEQVLRLGKKVELKEVKITRSQKQNQALHVFFTIISYELNEMGIEFCYSGVSGRDLQTRYTPHIVKEFFWRPIQIALFDVKSTTKIDTKQINEITDVVIKFFGDRGVLVEFPNIDSLINKKD